MMTIEYEFIERVLCKMTVDSLSKCSEMKVEDLRWTDAARIYCTELVLLNVEVLTTESNLVYMLEGNSRHSRKWYTLQELAKLKHYRIVSFSCSSADQTSLDQYQALSNYNFIRLLKVVARFNLESLSVYFSHPDQEMPKQLMQMISGNQFVCKELSVPHVADLEDLIRDQLASEDLCQLILSGQNTSQLAPAIEAFACRPNFTYLRTSSSQCLQIDALKRIADCRQSIIVSHLSSIEMATDQDFLIDFHKWMRPHVWHRDSFWIGRQPYQVNAICCDFHVTLRFIYAPIVYDDEQSDEDPIDEDPIDEDPIDEDPIDEDPGDDSDW